MGDARNNKVKKLSNIVPILVIIILIAILLRLLLVDNTVDVSVFNNRAHTNEVEIVNEVEIQQNIIDEAVGDTDVSETESLYELYTKFKGINEDTSMYIRIRDTNFNFPIVQQRDKCSKHNKLDNCFYLYRNIYKQSAVNKNAVSFVDCSANISTDVSELDMNTTIYGHTWKRQEGWGQAPRIGDPDDYQFGQLVSYQDMAWLKEHPVMEVNFGGIDTYWVPQFILYTDCTLDENPDGFNFSKRTLGAEDITKMYDRSVIVNSEGVDMEVDKLITLSTCNYKYTNDNTTRFVVVFKHIGAVNYENALDIAAKINYIKKDNDISWVK